MKLSLFYSSVSSGVKKSLSHKSNRPIQKRILSCFIDVGLFDLLVPEALAFGRQFMFKTLDFISLSANTPYAIVASCAKDK
ncbi:hypothetical protein [Microseira wollei]|uniref:Uncharacterized protein n=1 Tax=Microseira wollei NIES-4236 TaxID=2530354 RepID=A0AAV3X8H5_9CYAN|nr:hypothetical protein [Microseira wollei]GET37591.1 hypothetical protein MiSe_23450 [Microseira wollei NIES-4236]